MKKGKLTVLLLALLCGLALAAGAQAQISSNHDLSWNVTGGGGGRTGSARFAMTGTFGQPLAGQVESTSYTMNQGYWHPDNLVPCRIYLPIVIRAEA